MGSNFKLNSEETIIKEGKANLQKNIETIGGKLFLTNQKRLVFVSHMFNVQDGTVSIDLTQILRITPSWTKFLGFIPLAPNAFKINTIDGKTYTFTVFGRSEWLAEIDSNVA